MSLRSLQRMKSVDLVMPAIRSGSKFKVQGSTSPTPNSELGTRNSEQRRIQFRKDASEDIRVDLDSSTPCWNDAIGGALLNDRSLSSVIFTGALL